MTREPIHSLHEAFCNATGADLALTMSREQDWLIWQTYRKDRPFTRADLLRVITWLREQIRRGDRNPGALKFHNLVGNPDYFEEDLAAALAHGRAPAKRPTELEARGPAPEQPPRKTDEIINSPAFKAFVDLKTKL